MALHGDHAQAPRLNERLSGDLGQGNREAALAEPSPPNRNSGVRLRCPVRLGLLDRYSTVKHKCVEGVEYDGLSKLNEHIKRAHSEEYLCHLCMKTMEVHRRECKPIKPENRSEYPTFLDKGVLSEVRKWRTVLKDSTAPKGSGNLVVGRAEYIFGVINPGQRIPEQLVAFSQSPSSQSTSSQSPFLQSTSSQPASSQPVSPQPVSSQLVSPKLAFPQLTSPKPSFLWRSPEPPVSQSPAPPRGAKRQASSSRHRKPLGSRQKQDGPDAWMADKRAETSGTGLAPTILSQPQPGGHRAVPLAGQWYGPNNDRDLVSPFSLDNWNPHIDPKALDNAANFSRPIMYPMDVQSMGRSEITGLIPDTGTGSIVASDSDHIFNPAHQLLTPSLAENKDNDDADLEFARRFLAYSKEDPGTERFPDNLDEEDLFVEPAGGFSMFNLPN